MNKKYCDICEKDVKWKEYYEVEFTEEGNIDKKRFYRDICNECMVKLKLNK